MSRHIYCHDCNKRVAKLAMKYDELYESVEGKSKGEFFCDGCYPLNPIHTGDLCFAAVMLPDKDHFNYNFQKPEAWLSDYIIPLNDKIIAA